MKRQLEPKLFQRLQRISAWAKGASPGYFHWSKIYDIQPFSFEIAKVTAQSRWGLAPARGLFLANPRELLNASHWQEVDIEVRFVPTDSSLKPVLLTPSEKQLMSRYETRRSNYFRKFMAFSAWVGILLHAQIDTLLPPGGNAGNRVKRYLFGFLLTASLIAAVALGVYSILTVFFPPLAALPFIAAIAGFLHLFYFSPMGLAGIAIALPVVIGMVLSVINVIIPAFKHAKPSIPTNKTIPASWPARVCKFLLQCVTVPFSFAARLVATVISAFTWILSGGHREFRAYVVPYSYGVFLREQIQNVWGSSTPNGEKRRGAAAGEERREDVVALRADRRQPDSRDEGLRPASPGQQARDADLRPASAVGADAALKEGSEDDHDNSRDDAGEAAAADGSRGEAGDEATTASEREASDAGDEAYSETDEEAYSETDEEARTDNGSQNGDNDSILYPTRPSSPYSR
ncbi:MAG TPA: hypothetical protein VJB02_07065 [Coxiellaceae bacterium]|nr:hypothetical protein [Coxiellaceae bacterium]